jgi:hypothetical protein
MRACVVVGIAAVFTTACGDNAPLCPDPVPPLQPPACAAAPCTDVYVVAHPDDDLLFMNPDVLASIRAGRSTVVVYVTAGDLGPVPTDAYWQDRERGILNAYSYMACGGDAAFEAYVDPPELPPAWTRTQRGVGEITATEYQRASISLVFLRLGDFQTQCLWVQANGCSTRNPLPAGPPYVAFTLDGPREVTREALLGALESLLVERSATFVGVLDATNLHFDALGGARPDGTAENADHYFSALFATAAVVRAQARLAAPIAFATYRGYTLAREPVNIERDTACAKISTFARYAMFDAAIIRMPTASDLLADPDAYVAGAYELTSSISWQRRVYPTKTLARDTRGRVRSAAGCLGAQDNTPVLVDCSTAPEWLVTARGQLQLGEGDTCLSIPGPAGYTTYPLPQCGSATCEPAQTFASDAVVLAPCSEAGSVLALDNGQLRTTNGRCLAGDTTIVSADCEHAMAEGHATGVPIPAQSWVWGVE